MGTNSAPPAHATHWSLASLSSPKQMCFSRSTCSCLTWSAYFIDEAQEAEAKQVLHSIHDIREQSANEDNVVIAKVKHALAMLYFLLGDVAKVSIKAFAHYFYIIFTFVHLYINISCALTI